MKKVCCLKKKNAAYLVAIWNIILSLVDIMAQIKTISQTSFDDSMLSILKLISGLIFFLVNGSLLYGLWNEKPLFLLAWLLVDVMVILVSFTLVLINLMYSSLPNCRTRTLINFRKFFPWHYGRFLIFLSQKSKIGFHNILIF